MLSRTSRQRKVSENPFRVPNNVLSDTRVVGDYPIQLCPDLVHKLGNAGPLEDVFYRRSSEPFLSGIHIRFIEKSALIHSIAYT